LIKEESGNQFKVGDTTLHSSEIDEILQKRPERFSPNALMRTAYQQAILPNVHYTCGASEFIYWLEMPQLMKDLGLCYPQLGIRASAFMLKSTHKETLNQINLELNTFFLNDENFKQLMVERNQEELKTLSSGVTNLENSWGTIESELESKNIQTGKLSQSFNSFKSRLDKELKRISDNSTDSSPELKKAIKLKRKVWSNDFNQERNKDLISMIDELSNLMRLFEHQPNLFNNNRLIISYTS